jgi:O-antigen ligase
VLLSAEAFLRSLKPFWGAALLMAIGSLVLTRSTTSQISALVAIIAFLAFRWSISLAANSETRAALLRLAVVTGAAPFLIACWFLTPLHDYALDAEAFSGRGELWAVLGKLIADRPMLGFGYQSVFQVGDAGPLVQRNLVEWIRHVPQSHNGVLDLLVSVGWVGSLIFVLAMFADPWRRLSALPPALRDAWQPLCAALMAYAATHSLMEGKVFAADSIEWIVLVLVLGLSLRLKGIAAMIGLVPVSPASAVPISALWPEAADQP